MLPDLPWFVYAILLAPLGLLLGVAVYKSLQVRAAREWPSAAGKVVVSKAEVRKVKVIDSDRARRGIASRSATSPTSSTNTPSPAASCATTASASARTSEIFEVAETIAKYPVGAVVTVYYNPLHPDQAVLERDLPKGLWGCLGIGTAIVLAIVFGSAIGLHAITEFVIDAIPRTGKRPPFAVAFGAFGLSIALFALVLHRQASLARKWPVVPGTINRPGIEQYHVRAVRTPFGTQPGHVSSARCLSRIASTASNYTSEHASLGGSVSSTSSWLMREIHPNYQGRRQSQSLRQSAQSVAGHAGASRQPRVDIVAVRRVDLGRGVLCGGARY